MKELLDRPQYVNYMSGKLMGSSEFNNGGLDIFGVYVFPDVLKEHCTRQIPLPNFMDFDPIYYQKTRPVEIKTIEQQHLARPVELKSGINKLI